MRWNCCVGTAPRLTLGTIGSGLAKQTAGEILRAARLMLVMPSIQARWPWVQIQSKAIAETGSAPGQRIRRRFTSRRADTIADPRGITRTSGRPVSRIGSATRWPALEALDLRDAAVVAHSTAGGQIAGVPPEAVAASASWIDERYERALIPRHRQRDHRAQRHPSEMPAA